MQKTQSLENKVSYFVGVLALIFSLLGVFGSVRTLTNIYLFEKYPNGGVLSFNNNFMQREEDCQSYMGPMSYFDDKGQTRPATEDEKKLADEQKQICLSSVAKSRENAKINDISISLFYLFLGVGIFVGKKYL
jgi:hypothetical protein